MDIRLLDEAEVAEVYNTRMIYDFPPDERRPLKMILPLMKSGNYLPYGAFTDGHLEGYSFFIKLTGPVTGYMCDYLAIDKKLWGQGIGTEFQKRLCSGFFSDGDFLLCETEDTACASDPDDRETRERRLLYHKNVGWKDTGVRADTFGVRYILLEYPLKSLHSPDTVFDFYTEIYKVGLMGMFDTEKVIRRAKTP